MEEHFKLVPTIRESHDRSSNVRHVVFDMENTVMEAKYLAAALAELSSIANADANVVNFLAYELQDRVEAIHTEWARLFSLSQTGGAHA